MFNSKSHRFFLNIFIFATSCSEMLGKFSNYAQITQKAIEPRPSREHFYGFLLYFSIFTKVCGKNMAQRYILSEFRGFFYGFLSNTLLFTKHFECCLALTALPLPALFQLYSSSNTTGQWSLPVTSDRMAAPLRRVLSASDTRK